MHHFLITRNSYPQDYPYLKDRIVKFRNVTLASVKKQINKKFTWILTGDSGIGVEEFDDLNIVITRKWDEYINEIVKPGEWAITTRLDNDDYIFPEFISTIQERAMCSEFSEKETFIIDMSGIRYDLRYEIFYKDIYYSRLKCSPFLSLVERKYGEKKLANCYFDKHGLMQTHYPVDFRSNHLWVQMIHDTNKLMNKDNTNILSKRGILIDIHQLKEITGLGFYNLITDPGLRIN